MGRQYVSDAKRVREKAPDLAEKVRSGEMKLPEAVKEVKRQEAVEVAQLGGAGAGSRSPHRPLRCGMRCSATRGRSRP